MLEEDNNCDCDDLQPAREVWHEMESKGYREEMERMLHDSGKVDQFSFMLVHDAQQLGHIIELPHIPALSFNCEIVERGMTPEDTQSYLMDMITLRSLMVSTFMYGLYYRDKSVELEKLWKE